MRATPVVTMGLIAAAVLAGCPTDPVPPGADTDVVLEDTAPPDPDAEVVVAGACTHADDCLQGSVLPACKAVDCVAGECVVSDRPDGTACDDGSLCTTDEVCTAGRCTSAGPVCDDGNPCTTDGCDPTTGCVHTYNQAPCDDGDACTSGDRCFQGACTGQALDCDDLEQCTEDWCDPTLGCQHSDRAGPCDDGDACTVGDTCSAGACVSGGPVTCGDPDNPCQNASCDPDEGCVIELVTGDCDDGNACTEHDACVEGVCTGALVQCDDGNVCTDDYCDPAAGCQSFDNVLGCDDGDPCTLDDRCAEGSCVGGPPNPLCCDDVSQCDDGDPCTVDSCGADGLCAFVPRDCDDGTPCTRDLCDADGVCRNLPFGPIPDGPSPIADFDAPDDLDGWVLDSTNDVVGWQIDHGDFFSGGGSLYCGALPAYSYDFGATKATATTTIAIPPGDSTLSLWAKLSVEENVSCTYDVLRVRVDGEALDPAMCSSLANWTAQSWDVTPWAGRSVTLTFEFDTFDDQANSGMGVWIDAVTLTTVTDLACCDAPDDCTGGGAGCLAETCDATSYQCLVPPASVACDDDDPCTADSCQADGDCDHAPISGCP